MKKPNGLFGQTNIMKYLSCIVLLAVQESLEAPEAGTWQRQLRRCQKGDHSLAKSPGPEPSANEQTQWPRTVLNSNISVFNLGAPPAPKRTCTENQFKTRHAQGNRPIAAGGVTTGHLGTLTRCGRGHGHGKFPLPLSSSLVRIKNDAEPQVPGGPLK